MSKGKRLSRAGKGVAGVEAGGLAVAVAATQTEPGREIAQQITSDPSGSRGTVDSVGGQPDIILFAVGAVLIAVFTFGVGVAIGNFFKDD